MRSPDAFFWKEAINNEIESIIGNNTWILTDLPPGTKGPFGKLRNSFGRVVILEE
jgi:hypothetical protein